MCVCVCVSSRRRMPDDACPFVLLNCVSVTGRFPDNTNRKSRREACDFVGGDVIKRQLEEGVTKRRVGLVTTGAPAREHSMITLADGTMVGEVTSGGFSPNLKKNISMGYVQKEHAKKGTELKVVVRKKVNDAVVTPMPFVPAKYHRPASA